jgi:hypothetical protein
VTWQEDGNCSEGIPVNKQKHHDHYQQFSNSAKQSTIKENQQCPRNKNPEQQMARRLHFRIPLLPA